MEKGLFLPVLPERDLGQRWPKGWLTSSLFSPVQFCLFPSAPPGMGTVASPGHLAFYSEEVPCPGCPCCMNRCSPAHSSSLQPTISNLRGISAALFPQVQGRWPLTHTRTGCTSGLLERLAGAEGKRKGIWSRHPTVVSRWPLGWRLTSACPLWGLSGGYHFGCRVRTW